MLTKSFFNFLFGFLLIVILGVLGATFFSRHSKANQSMFANTTEER